MLNINALWWPLTPSRVEAFIKYDDRWTSDSLLYAMNRFKDGRFCLLELDQF